MKAKGVLIILVMLFCILCGAVHADEISLRGTVKNIDLGSGTIIVMTYEGKDVPIGVEDEETLQKFKDGRIRVDDDVKIKYITKGAKNLSTYFKRTAGCF